LCRVILANWSNRDMSIFPPLYCIYVVCLSSALLYLRRLSSLFSSVSPPLYCIYIVCLPPDLLYLHSLSSPRSTVSPPLYCIYIVCLPSVVLHTRCLFFLSAIVLSTESFFPSTILHLLSLSSLCSTVSTWSVFIFSTAFT
jgi:hypothetical protein